MGSVRVNSFGFVASKLLGRAGQAAKGCKWQGSGAFMISRGLVPRCLRWVGLCSICLHPVGLAHPGSLLFSSYQDTSRPGVLFSFSVGRKQTLSVILRDQLVLLQKSLLPSDDTALGKSLPLPWGHRMDTAPGE